MAQTLMAPQSEDSWVGWKRAVPAAGLVGVCAAASLSDVSADEGQIFCPFRLATGGWCPGCGGTRALKHLVHGDVASSLTLNPLLLVVMTQFVALATAFLVIPDKTRSWFRQNLVTIGKTNIILALSIWAVRLWTDRIPAPFEAAVPIAELWRNLP